MLTNKFRTIILREYLLINIFCMLILTHSKHIKQILLFKHSDDLTKKKILSFADERDAIQKKTFTKWINNHLRKAGGHVTDLFEDLRDGQNLLTLLELLSNEKLPRERGKLRFHKLQNIETALNFLKQKNVKLVNIRPVDIFDGNPKLCLGLIWTIILHFQVSMTCTFFYK